MRTFPSSVILTVVLTVAFVISALSIILTVYYHGKGEAFIDYQIIMDNEQDSLSLAANALASPMIANSILIKESLAEVKFCSIALDSPNFYQTFDYTPLINIQNANVQQTGTAMQSIGVISVDGAGTSSADFSNKVSAEMSLDTYKLGCSDYVYAASDNSTNFVGYCAYANGSVDISKQVYGDRDTGLTPEEKTLFSTKSQIGLFTPIFLLIDQMSITYERSHWCDGDVTAYASTFAQKNVGQLNQQIAGHQVGKNGVGYFVEKKTGYLLPNTIGEPIVLNKTLTTPQKAGNYIIRQSAEMLLAVSDWSGYSSGTFLKGKNGLLVDIRPTTIDGAGADIGWLQVVAVPQSDYEGQIKRTAKWGVLAACLCSLILLIPLNLFFHYVYSRPLEDPKIPTYVREIQRGRDKLLGGNH